MTLSPAAARPADPASFPSVLDEPAAARAAAPDGVPAAAPAQPGQPEANRPAGSADPTVDRPGARSDGFAALGLPRPLLRTLTEQGITEPFPIQTATIPDALAGRDVLGRGQTGSGKTLAFGLPLLARVARGGRPAPGHPKALVLVPTRELAMQVNDVISPLARSMRLFSRTAVGGTPYDRQIRDLRRGVDVLVATPGRLADLIERGECSLANIAVTVLDEADQMADMGFLPDVTALLEQTPAGTQRLLFSATLDKDVDALVQRFLANPATHEVDPAAATVSTMDHHLLLIPPGEKLPVITHIAARPGRTIMFVRTQLAVDRLVEQLAKVGVRAGALHGGKTQAVRTRTLAQFREGTTNVLVATDVAARGIHVDGVSLVVHIDPPRDSKDYLHRAGRTARAGESGTVVTLVLPKQRAGTFSLVQRAGVVAGRVQVRAGAPELAELTGARAPSGVPVRADEPAHRTPRPARVPWAGHGTERPTRHGTPPGRHSGQQADRPASQYGRHAPGQPGQGRPAGRTIRERRHQREA